MRGPEAEARLRDAPSARLSNGQRDPEVRDERLTPLAEQDVARLDVAVDDAVLVSVVERVCDFLRDRDGVFDSELLLTVDALAERLPPPRMALHRRGSCRHPQNRAAEGYADAGGWPWS